MEMESMIEKVARALSIADGNHQDDCSNDEDETPAWKLYVGSARAALEAMREPTEAMEDSGEKAIYDLPRHIAVMAYEAMINAALNEHES